MADDTKSSSGDYVNVHSGPLPDWEAPTKHVVPYSGEKIQKDPSKMDGCYSLMISAVVPRPIAFVSSRSNSGSINLSPFSYFNAMAHNPPVVTFSVCRNMDGSKKDTLVNIEESGECVVAIINEWFVEAANHTCGNWPYDMDEFDVSGLTKVDASVVKAPLVKESAMNMECKVLNMLDIKDKNGNVSATIVTCEVVLFHVMKDVLDDKGLVDIQKYRPVSRLGGVRYSNVREGWDLRRPRYKKPE